MIKKLTGLFIFFAISACAPNGPATDKQTESDCDIKITRKEYSDVVYYNYSHGTLQVSFTNNAKGQDQIVFTQKSSDKKTKSGIEIYSTLAGQDLDTLKVREAIWGLICRGTEFPLINTLQQQP